MTPEQRGRLPKFAKDELDRLERRLLEAERVAAEISGADADVWVDPYGRWPRPVGRNVRVRFAFDGVDGNSWIDLTRKGRAIELMASSSLAVVPQSSNVVRVGVGR